VYLSEHDLLRINVITANTYYFVLNFYLIGIFLHYQIICFILVVLLIPHRSHITVLYTKVILLS